MTPSRHLAPRRVALILGAAWLAGCAAPTVLNTQWANPQFVGKPPIRSILVMGITKDPTNRRIFEDQMVAQLQANGVQFSRLPADQPWLWREAYLQDPDGNPLCLYFAGENRLNPPWRIA